jgi:D-glycero-beta-D-manno-heptose-7-phosphate kinase
LKNLKKNLNTSNKKQGSFLASQGLGLKIIVLGDVMIDSYLWGTVDRISPEAPVPVVSVKNREKRLGGAANVALNLKALGCTPVVVSVIGNDQDGKDLIKLFVENQLSTEGLIISDQRVTTIKHRIISDKHLLRVDSEQTDDIDSTLATEVVAKLKELLHHTKCLIFQDYNKGVLSAFVIKESIALATQFNIATAVDPKKKNFEAYKGVTLFKPNLKEINEALGTAVQGSQLEELVAIGKQFILKNEIKSALITLSEHGALLVTPETHYYVKAHKRAIVDVSGAGDTVIAVASAFLGLGEELQNVLSYSNLAGGLVCEHIGVVPIDYPSLINEIELMKK